MKLTQILCVAAVVLSTASPAFAVSQTALAGYRGIVFGESQASAELKLGKLFKVIRSGSTGPLYRGTVVGLRETMVMPSFMNKRFVGLVFGFSSQQSMTSIQTYDLLKGRVKDAYGEPTWTGFYWYQGKQPDQSLDDKEKEYDWDEIYKLTSEGNTYLSTRWEFEDGNRIELETETASFGMWVSLRYSNPELQAKELKKRTQTEL